MSYIVGVLEDDLKAGMKIEQAISDAYSGQILVKWARSYDSFMKIFREVNCIWFLDIMVPMSDGKRASEPVGIQIAEFLNRQGSTIPRFCISDEAEKYKKDLGDQKFNELYVGSIPKADSKTMAVKVKEALENK